MHLKSKILISRFRILLILLVVLLILNIADTFQTWFMVTPGYAIEVNPVMDWVIREGAIQFFGLKLGLVPLITIFFYMRFKRKFKENKKLDRLLLNISIFMFGWLCLWYSFVVGIGTANILMYFWW